MQSDEQDLLAAVVNADLKMVVKLASSPNINKVELRDDLLNSILCLALDLVDNNKPATVKIAEQLIIKGYPLTSVNSTGDTPLHIAMRKGHVELVITLIKKGADLHAKNGGGDTPVDLAVEYNINVEDIYKKCQENRKKSAEVRQRLQTPLQASSKEFPQQSSSSNSLKRKRNQEVEQKKSNNEIELIAPGDGHCLFWSTVFAYLLPSFIDSKSEYEKRINIILDEMENADEMKNHVSENLKNIITPESCLLKQHNILINVVRNFRKKIYDYILKNGETYSSFMEDDCSIHDYVKKMRDSSNWAGEVEIRAISDFLKIKIKTNDHTYGDEEFKHNGEINLNYTNCQESSTSSQVKNHYNFFLKKKTVDKLLENHQYKLKENYGKIYQAPSSIIGIIEESSIRVLKRERYLPYLDGYDLGYGIDEKNEVTTCPVVSKGKNEIEEKQSIITPNGSLSYHFISSSEELNTLKKLFIKGKTDYYAFKASGCYDQMAKIEIKSNKMTCLIVHIVESRNKVTIKEPELSEAVKKEIEKMSLEEFLNLYGTHFIGGRTSAAVFYGTITITTENSEDINSIKSSLSLGVGVNNFLPGLGVEIDGSLKDKLKKISSRSSIESFVRCRGVELHSGKVDSVEKLDEAHQNFIGLIKTASMPSQAICQPWTTFPEIRSRYFNGNPQISESRFKQIISALSADQDDVIEINSVPTAKTPSPYYNPGFFPPARTAVDAIAQKSREVRQSNKVTEAEVATLLDEVGKGDLNVVCKLLKKNNALLYATGKMMDVAGKEYKEITVLQYAFIAGDIGMCKMILEEFREEEKSIVAHQLNADLINQHGGVFTLEPTLKEYQLLETNLEKWSITERDKHWCEKIGQCQQTWPAWLRYDFTEPGMNALWYQQNVCGIPKKRDNKDLWSKSCKSGHELELGRSFAWGRGRLVGGAIGWENAQIIPRNLLIALGFTPDVVHDFGCLNKEEAAIKEYRKTLLNTSTSSPTHGEQEKQTPEVVSALAK